MSALAIELFGYTASTAEIILSSCAVLIFIAGLVKAVREIIRDGWIPFRDRWISPRKARKERQEFLLGTVEAMSASNDRMGLQISEILHEVKLNGGESLKDRIVSIDSKVENIVARVRHQDETTENPTFRLDEKGEMIFSNSAFRELLGVEDGDLLHNNYLSLIEPTQRTRFIQELGESIRYKMPIDSVLSFKTTGAKYIAVRLQASPDVRHGGILRGFFGMASTAELI